MSYTNLRKKTEGFTIIEVLIVLAIAGLIMMVVFLAVPALQRNSRNNQYRSQASNYAAAVSEWRNNNNGRAPANGDVAAINALSADGPITEPAGITSGAQTADPAISTMQLNVGVRCSTTTIGDTVAGSGRSIAIRYSVENSAGAPTKQCLEV